MTSDQDLNHTGTGSGRYNLERNIVLIGFMGTGKTSIGRRLAARLNREFIDTDREIEKVTGLSIDQIFSRCGEIRFRSEEALVIKKVTQKRGCVIATGGGVVLNQENVARLQENGILIRLTASPEVIYRRVGRKNRPLLKRNRSPEQIERMLQEREPYYSCAALTIDTTNFEPDEIIERIISFIEGGAGFAETDRQPGPAQL